MGVHAHKKGEIGMYARKKGEMGMYVRKKGEISSMHTRKVRYACMCASKVKLHILEEVYMGTHAHARACEYLPKIRFLGKHTDGKYTHV
jgi:hypothetical protein